MKHFSLESIFRVTDVSPNILKEGGWVFFLRLINIALSFFSTVLLSRFLGASGYGIYAYAYALVTLLILPAEAGLPNLIVRETAKGIAQNRPELIQGVWRWSGKTVSVLAIALIFVAGPPLLFWRGGINSLQGQTLAWALILVPVVALGNLRGAALRGLKKIIAGQLPEFIIRPTLFVLFMLVVFKADFPISPSVLMFLNVLAAAVAFLVGIWMLWRYTPNFLRKAIPARPEKSWFASSFLFALIAGFGVINNQASTVIIGIFHPSADVGVYRVALQISVLASVGLQTINMIVAPQFADLFAKKKISYLQHLVVISARAVFTINLVLTFLFLLLGKSFLGVFFGVEFEASFSPLAILLVGQLLNSAVGSVGYLLNMTGHENETTLGLGIAAVTNIVLGFILIPDFGIEGAAIASTISMILWNLLLWRKVYQVLGINSLAFSVDKKVV